MTQGFSVTFTAVACFPIHSVCMLEHRDKDSKRRQDARIILQESETQLNEQQKYVRYLFFKMKMLLLLLLFIAYI